MAVPAEPPVESVPKGPSSEELRTESKPELQSDTVPEPAHSSAVRAQAEPTAIAEEPLAEAKPIKPEKPPQRAKTPRPKLPSPEKTIGEELPWRSAGRRVGWREANLRKNGLQRHLSQRAEMAELREKVAKVLAARGQPAGSNPPAPGLRQLLVERSSGSKKARPYR